MNQKHELFDACKSGNVNTIVKLIKENKDLVNA